MLIFFTLLPGEESNVQIQCKIAEETDQEITVQLIYIVTQVGQEAIYYLATFINKKQEFGNKIIYTFLRGCSRKFSITDILQQQ